MPDPQIITSEVTYTVRVQMPAKKAEGRTRAKPATTREYSARLAEPHVDLIGRGPSGQACTLRVPRSDWPEFMALVHRTNTTVGNGH